MSIPEKLLLYKLQTEHDPESYGELYDAYVKRIYRFVYFKVSSHEEAEDITSDIFLRVWHYLQEGKEVKSFSGLLYRTARNCIIDWYRQKGTKLEITLDETIEFGDGGAWYKELGDKIDAEKIISILKKLKQEYREVIILRYVDGLETKEIAEIMGKGPLSVRVTLHRAMKKLQELMSREEPKNNRES